MSDILREAIREAVLAELKLDKNFLAMLKGGEDAASKKTFAARGRKIAEEWIKETEREAEAQGLGHLITFSEQEQDYIISLGAARYSHYNRQRHNHAYVVEKLKKLFTMRFLAPKIQKLRAQVQMDDEASFNAPTLPVEEP